MMTEEMRYIYQRKETGRYYVRVPGVGTVGTFGTPGEAMRRRDEALQCSGAADLREEMAGAETDVQFPDRKEAEMPDWRDLIALASEMQAVQDAASDVQRVATVEIDTDRPIAVMHSGDWQLGDGATDHDTWRADMEFLLETDGLYMIDLGDEIQNMRSFKHLAAVLGQVLQPQQQAWLFQSVVDEMTTKGKLLAKVAGNHDLDFDERVFGEALQAYLLNRMRAPRFTNRGLLKLQVGQTLYTELLFHKSRFRSFMRPTHGNYREMLITYPADIVAGAHDHDPGYELIRSFPLAREAGMGFGGETYLIKCGTYQDSEFGWRFFGNAGRPLNPTVVLWPDRHKKQVFTDPRDAVAFIRSL